MEMWRMLATCVRDDSNIQRQPNMTRDPPTSSQYSELRTVMVLKRSSPTAGSSSFERPRGYSTSMGGQATSQNIMEDSIHKPPPNIVMERGHEHPSRLHPLRNAPPDLSRTSSSSSEAGVDTGDDSDPDGLVHVSVPPGVPTPGEGKLQEDEIRKESGDSVTQSRQASRPNQSDDPPDPASADVSHQPTSAPPLDDFHTTYPPIEAMSNFSLNDPGPGDVASSSKQRVAEIPRASIHAQAVPGKTACRQSPTGTSVGRDGRDVGLAEETTGTSDNMPVELPQTDGTDEDRWWEEKNDSQDLLSSDIVEDAPRSQAALSTQPSIHHQPPKDANEAVIDIFFSPPEPENTSTTATSSTQPQPRAETAPTNNADGSLTTQPRAPPPKGQQKSETYQIKHINWSDGRSAVTRQSPILVQNANGPCPLLALVNALSLSTPPGSQSALVETLCVREQISLGLLLDAVLEELITSRAGAAAPDLPDVSDLYQFLRTLHTGMNVNPRFVPAPLTAPNVTDAPAESTPEGWPTSATTPTPGSFEDTQGVQLYGTFSIPFVHGWLPSKDHPAFAALQRSAQTYEDAQNLLFREEELEEKLRHDGLNTEEQLQLQDVVIIKYFLGQSATQLTQYGLEALSRSLPPGSLCILFRNDHFSTIYVHPSSRQLLQLVTDMGYSQHAEIIWESLVDVTGEGSEFFAGDFRVVSHASESSRSPPRQQQRVRSLIDEAQGWTGVGDGRKNKQGGRAQHRGPGVKTGGREEGIGSIGERLDTSVGESSSSTAVTTTQSPTTEQEDHDLALALQLQEEEEDQHRRELAAARRSSGTRPQRPSLNNNSFHHSTRSGGAGVGSGSPSLNNNSFHHSTRSGGAGVGSGSPSRGPPVQQQIRSMITPATPTTHNITPIPITTSNNNNTNNNDPDSTAPDVPPPTYEQAARTKPYHPPPSHPAHAASPISPPSPSTLTPQSQTPSTRLSPSNPQAGNNSRYFQPVSSSSPASSNTGHSGLALWSEAIRDHRRRAHAHGGGVRRGGAVGGVGGVGGGGRGPRQDFYPPYLGDAAHGRGGGRRTRPPPTTGVVRTAANGVTASSYASSSNSLPGSGGPGVSAEAGDGRVFVGVGQGNGAGNPYGNGTGNEARRDCIVM
ncbi:MAG: RuvB-like protein 2 [Watsoniomyces obsoletus]|nr:MAG: RuvB-like protein 2 [Watsoniomyces obsoletus]